MTHTAATFTHPSDPPEAPVSKWHPYSKWTVPIVERLKELHQTLSSRECANRLSAEFKIPFSRGSVIGKLHRLGLTVSDKAPVDRAPRVKRERQAPRPNRPVLRIIRSNGNSPNLKVTYPVERGFDALPVHQAALNLTLADLPESGCRFVTTNAAPWLYCGLDRKPGSSFCRQCHQIVWIPATDRNQRTRGMR